jgi:uncharacterized protein YodC (DUF2158 family)
MEEIKTGDTVRIKSGGVFMTVGGVSNGQATCYWMDNKQKQNSAIWPLTVLEKIDLDAEPPMPSFG